MGNFPGPAAHNWLTLLADDTLCNAACVPRLPHVWACVYLCSGQLARCWYGCLYSQLFARSRRRFAAVRYEQLDILVRRFFTVCMPNFCLRDDLPTILYPAHSIALIGTTLTKHRAYSFGLVQALMYGLFQFGGFLAAGGILKGFGVTSGATASTTLMNFAATNVNTYVMYWFGCSVIAFSFVYNRLFKQESETPLATANRTAAVTAIAIFAMTVAFFSLGLNSYSSAIYAAQAIVANGVWPAQFVGDTVNSQAFFVCVDLLAVPATVWVAVIIFVLLLQGVEYLGATPPTEYAYSTQDPGAPQYNQEKVSSNMSTSSRLKQRNAIIDVNY